MARPTRPKQEDRRLAAILVADVAGYTEMIGQDERGTLAAIRRFWANISGPIVTQHKGVVFKNNGDDFLAEFPSAVQALRAAILIQERSNTQRQRASAGPHVQVRIGLHHDDVVAEGGDLFGLGVNIAARLCPLAPPNGICISQTVLDTTRGRLSLTTKDLGQPELKGIPDPIRVYRVVLPFEPPETIPEPPPPEPPPPGPWPPRTPFSVWRDRSPDLSEAALPEMVTLPAGDFLMGAPAEEAESRDNECPQRRVRVPSFALGRCGMTFAQWDAACDAGAGLRWPGDRGWGRGDRPVINVSWHDAQAYCTWLNGRLGLKGAYRLPTEAEWEYACRAGTVTPFSFGATISTDQANYNGNHIYGAGHKGIYRWRTVPVGSLPGNAWGLHEMHGNVWEWVEDAYKDRAFVT